MTKFRRSSWWTDERRELLTELWPQGVKVEEITRRLSELPGASLDVIRVARQATVLNLKRPPGYRSTAAQVPHRSAWKALVRDPNVQVLRLFDLENIEARYKGNDDVLFLCREIRRLWERRHKHWPPGPETLDLRPHEVANLEMRHCGENDFEDLMTELRRLRAIPR